MATAIIGGGYMLFTAVLGTFFGTLVDHHRKKQVMVTSSTITLVAYAASGGLWLLLGEDRLADWGSAWFWLFTAVILVGGVVESLRNIALSTTVTLLVPEDGRDKANGLVGTVQGIAFMITSVFSGLSVGCSGWDGPSASRSRSHRPLAAPPAPHRDPRAAPDPEAGGSRFDVRGAVAAITAVPGWSR